MQYDPDFDKVVLYCPFSEPDGDFKDYSSTGHVLNRQDYDPYYNNVVLQLPFDEAAGSYTFKDYSKYNRTIANGGRSTSSNTSKYETASLYIYNNVNISTTIPEIGTSDATIEFWVYPLTGGHGNNYGRMFHLGPGNVAGSIDVSFWVNENPSSIHSEIWYAASQSTGLASSAVANNTWHHVALTKAGSLYKLWINGVEVANNTQSVSISQTTLYIGNNPASEYMNGYLQDFRVTIGVARYTSTFTPQLLKRRFGNLQIKDYCGFVNNCGLRYGPYSSDLDLNSMTNYTIETWFYTFGNYNNEKRILSAGGGAATWNTTTGVHWLLQIYNGKEIRFNLSSTSSPYEQTPYMKAVFDSGRWNHVAVTKSGSEFSMFLNGNLVNRITYSNLNRPSTNPPGIDVGTVNGDTTYYFIGWMRDLRITKNVCRYTNSFIPQENLKDSTASDPYFSSVVLLVPFYSSTDTSTSAPVDISSNPKSASIITGVYTQHTNPNLYGYRSHQTLLNSFTLSANTPKKYQFEYDDFTIECYVKLFTLGTYTRCILSQYISLSTNVGFQFWINTANKLCFAAGNNIPINLVGDTAVAANTWYHIAVARSAGTTKIFLNGAEQTANHTGSVYISNGSYLKIGIAASGENGNVDGIIRDLRITKGLARYTTTFTPPETIAGRISGRLLNASNQPQQMKVIAVNEYSQTAISDYSDPITGDYSLIVPPIKHTVGVVPTDGSDVLWQPRVMPT